MTATQVSAGTKIVRCNPNSGSWQVHADICVIGSGAAGMSAAIEAARAGRRVVLVDSMPALGGQAVIQSSPPSAACFPTARTTISSPTA